MAKCGATMELGSFCFKCQREQHSKVDVGFRAVSAHIDYARGQAWEFRWFDPCEDDGCQLEAKHGGTHWKEW